MEGEGGVTTVTKNEMKDILVKTGNNLKEDEMSNSMAYTITGRFNSAVILKYIEFDKAGFDRYNPGFDNKIALESKYELRLPAQMMNIFIAKRYEILNESIQLLLKPSVNATY
jgi:membrane-bound lytic murein transglycosylase D